jgi:hypothetical protein
MWVRMRAWADLGARARVGGTARHLRTENSHNLDAWPTTTSGHTATKRSWCRTHTAIGELQRRAAHMFILK